MATPELSEAIALTEKKMDMTLDDIIKMSKKPASKGKRPPRASNKSQGFLNGRAPQGNSRIQRFMDSRSSIRQGVLAQRRSNFQRNQFLVTTEVARKAAVFPRRNMVSTRTKPRAVVAPLRRNEETNSFAAKEKVVSKQKPQTLDARFADMKEQRMKVMSQQQMAQGRIPQSLPQRSHRQQQWRAGGVTQAGGPGRRFGNFAR